MSKRLYEVERDGVKETVTEEELTTVELAEVIRSEYESPYFKAGGEGATIIEEEEMRKDPKHMTLTELRQRWPLTLAEKERQGILTEEEQKRLKRLERYGKPKEEQPGKPTVES